jgi:hypothetical protein
MKNVTFFRDVTKSHDKTEVKTASLALSYSLLDKSAVQAAGVGAKIAFACLCSHVMSF